MNNFDLEINKIITRLNDASKVDQGLSLTSAEVKILADEFGDIYYAPVITGEQIVQLCKEGKFGQEMIKK